MTTTFTESDADSVFLTVTYTSFTQTAYVTYTYKQLPQTFSQYFPALKTRERPIRDLVPMSDVAMATSADADADTDV